MTPERMAALVAGWVRLYTWRLPPETARRRNAELDADLHDHIAFERAHGSGDRRIALAVLVRALRGLAADLAWRGEAMPRTASRSALRVALVTTCVLMVPFVGNQVSDGFDWSAGDFSFAAVLLAGSGCLLELMLRRPAKVLYRAAAAGIGVGAMAFGEADDAPGLVLFGCLLVAGTVALAVRATRRRA